VQYKKVPDLAARIMRPDQGQEVTGFGRKPSQNYSAIFRPNSGNLGGWRGRVGGLNQARVIEYLIGDDMRLFLLRALPAMWTQLG
jgi:hypothetical protein